MKTIYLTAICLAYLILISCSQKPNEKGEFSMKPNEQSRELRIKYNDKGSIEYIQEYSNGNPEGMYVKYLQNGNPKNITFIREQKNNGSGMVFHNNGYLNNYGQYVHGEKTGWFYVFDNKGNLTGKREYIIINGISYLNQWLDYKSDGTINRLNSSYIVVNAKNDTIKNGDEYQLEAALEASFLKQYMILVIGPFDENFQVKDNATCDTIKAVNFKANYKTSFYQKGKNTIRGLIAEIKPSDKNDKKVDIRKIYFTKEFLVR